MSPPDTSMEGVVADPVDELRWLVDIPDREVRALADLQRCRSPRRAQAPWRRCASSPSRHSSTVIRNSVAAMFIASSSDVSGEVPGLQSVATAIGTPYCAERLDRRRVRLADEVEGAGKHHRDRASFRHRANARLAGVFEVVGGERAVSRRQRSPAEIGKLVGVELDREPALPRGVEHSRDLLRREGDTLAEGIDRVREPLLRDRGQHLLRHLRDVALLVAPRLRRQRVRAEEGRRDADVTYLAQTTGDPKRLALVFECRARTRTSPQSWSRPRRSARRAVAASAAGGRPRSPRAAAAPTRQCLRQRG